MAALVLVVATIIGAGQQPAGEPGVTGTSILVGIEGPTGAFSSDEENLGMRLVVQVTNDGGGIEGRKLVARGHPRAGGAAIEHVVANVKRLVEEDGVFLVFNHGGPAAVSIAPYAMQRRVPNLFPHTALLTADADRYVFTSYPRYLGESQVMLRDLAVTRRFTRIGIMHDEKDWTTGGIMPPGSFSKANHHAQRAGFICEIAGGQFRALGGWIEP